MSIEHLSSQDIDIVGEEEISLHAQEYRGSLVSAAP